MSGRYRCQAPFVRSRIRTRVSFLPEASNRHSSTDSEASENSEKLTPRPSKVAPRGKGEPADCCARSRCEDVGFTAAFGRSLRLRSADQCGERHAWVASGVLLSKS